METALEFSFYVLGAVFALGLLMVLVLVKDVFFHSGFRTILPPVKRVPTNALDAARLTLKTLQAALQAAHGERHDAIAYEMRHLEHRISALEDKTYTDQADYYDAAKARERTWREWRTLHERARAGGWRERRALRNPLDEQRMNYRRLEQEVEEEYQRAVARDTLTLEELRAQGVLEPEVLAPPAQAAAGKAPAAGQAPGQPAAHGERTRHPGKWMTPLTPYPPAQAGLLGQADMAMPDVQKSERTYLDPAFSMAGLPGAMLTGVDFSRSSFAEVEFGGVHRYVRCAFVATDLRRIELRRAESPHVFQDCDLRGASLAQAQLAGVAFRRCNLSGTHWRNARLDHLRFESCRMENVHWEGVDLSRTVMSEDMLQTADFAFASKPPLNLRPAMGLPPELSSSGPPPTEQLPEQAQEQGPPQSAQPLEGAPQQPAPQQPSPQQPAGGGNPGSAPGAAAQPPPAAPTAPPGAEGNAGPPQRPGAAPPSGAAEPRGEADERPGREE
jgi:uncharacterized protein YjbI with pentapeptide repeats